MNFGILALAALFPLIFGALWYSQFLFGKTWMGAGAVPETKMTGGQMAGVYILTYVFSLFVAMALQFIVIHQAHFKSILMNEPGINDPASEMGMMYTNFMAKYGQNFRTFKHGMLHGTIGGIMLALPVIAITAMFERRGFKYIAIHAGFWIICFMIMGGIVSAFA